MRSISANKANVLDFEVVDGLEALRQRVVQRLKFFLGEYYINRRQGIPYLEQIAGHNHDLSLPQRIITDQILSFDEITAVEDVEVRRDPSTRTFYYTAGRVISIYGETELSVDI